MERNFDLSEGRTAYVESDNDAHAVYVISKHPDGWVMRTDAPLHLTTSERFAWARAEAKRQRAEMRKTNDDE